MVVLPSLKRSKIKEIKEYKTEKDSVHPNESVVISLEDDVDVSRGNMLVKESELLQPKTELKATICWMEEQPAIPGKMYWLQHGPNRVKAKLTSINHVIDINTLQPVEAINQFFLNDIGEAQIKLAKPIFADAYNENPANGSFILIDEFSNNTVGVGFVR